MEKTFYFIDGVQPDKTSKKLMRRHVMKGKNAGKKIHRPSRLHQPNTSTPLDLDRRPSSDQGMVAPRTVDKKFGDTILTGCLPAVEVNPCSLRIINQFFDLTSERLYPTTIGFSLCEAKLVWLRLLFTDEAAYHCNVSLMQACNELYLGNGRSTTPALYHLSQTFAQIRRRLESRDALSDSTMGLVISLITQEQIRDQGHAAEVHAKGLQRMVDLRGGLHRLDDNLTLVLRVCKADILLSLQSGKPTMFFRDGMAEVWKKLASDGHRLDHVRVLPCSNLNPYLRGILSDMLNICCLLNNGSRQPILDLLGFEEIFVSVCYSLLQFIPITDSTGRIDSQEACHLGLLMFVMTTFFQIGRNRIMEFEALSLRFHAFLNDPCESETDLSLWLLVLGGIWSSRGMEREVIASKIRLFTRQKGIDSWSKFQERLVKFPWIYAVHDRPAHQLWARIQDGHLVSNS